MHVLVTCKNEDDQIKMKELECSQDFSHYKSMGIFPDAQGQLTPQSFVRSGRIELVRDVMDDLVTCKYEEDPIKNEGARVVSTFSHYNPMGAIGCHGHQSSDPIWSKT